MDDANRRKSRLADFFREVWGQGRIEAADDYIAPQYTLFHDPGDPWDGQTLDLAAFKARVQLSRAPFPDQHFDVQGFYADGRTVVATWLWRGTHLGEFPGYPASGKVIHMSGATAYTFDEDERLLGHWQITDRLGVFRQLQANKA